MLNNAVAKANPPKLPNRMRESPRASIALTLQDWRPRCQLMIIFTCALARGPAADRRTIPSDEPNYPGLWNTGTVATRTSAKDAIQKAIWGTPRTVPARISLTGAVAYAGLSRSRYF